MYSTQVTNAVEEVPASSRKALVVVYRRIGDLKPDPRNPRKHSPRQVRQIAKSITSFDFNVPVLLDADDRIVAGHGRVLACQLLGWEMVPTISLAHLTPAQAKAFLIADNRLTEIAEWDDQLLAEQFKELSLLDLTFDLDATGFDMAEIDLRIESLNAADAEPDAADEVEVAVGSAVTKPGDIWMLGAHRIICGDALEEATYKALLLGSTAAIVFTDPPYNVRVQGHVCGKGAIRHREFAAASGEMSKAEFTEFLRRTCSLLVAHSKSGSVHYLCIDWRHLCELLAAGQANYSEQLNLCVWTKTNGGMGSLYRSQHELVLVFKNGTDPHCNNVQLGKFGRNRTNVWNYRGVNDFGRETEEGNLLALHPTVKPVGLVADAILDCSNRGDVVLDAFLGSGTTVIAAERTGRRCHGIEIDPLYVDTAIRRWQKFTGDRAIHVATQRSFAEIEGINSDV